MENSSKWAIKEKIIYAVEEAHKSLVSRKNERDEYIQTNEKNELVYESLYMEAQGRFDALAELCKILDIDYEQGAYFKDYYKDIKEK